MRRILVCTMALLIGIGTVALAQGKITSVDEHAKVMKSNQQAFGAANKAIGSGAYADARMQLATVRQNFMALQAFWMDKKRDDALAIVKDGLTRLDALDKLLASPTVDQMAAQAAAKEFAPNTCGACHKLYREGDAQTGFRFKPGVI